MQDFTRRVLELLLTIPKGKVVTYGQIAPAFVFGGIDEQKRRLEADGIEVVDGKVDLEKYRFDFVEICH